MTKEEINKAIGDTLLATRKLPTGGELSKKTGITAAKANQALVDYRKTETIAALVHPDGKLYTFDGEIIWRTNSAGSITQAFVKRDKTLGLLVYG